MPALRRTFDEGPLPPRMVVDSSFVFEAFLDSDGSGDRHERCLAFADRLIEEATEVIVSPLVYLEAPQCWRRLQRRGVLPGSGPHDSQESVAAAFVRTSAQLRQFLMLFKPYEFDLTAQLIELATAHAGRHSLNAHDALVDALCTAAGSADLVALDHGFRRVDGMTLWEL